MSERFAEHLSSLESKQRIELQNAAKTGPVEIRLAKEPLPKVLADALEKTLALKVKPTVRTDPDLVAGACLKIGELVLDGSVRAQLQKVIEGRQS